MNRLMTITTALAFAALTLAPAHAQDGRTPLHERGGGTTTVREPGHYYLVRDFQRESGTAILVTASNVTIDLNGHTLSGPGNNTGIGVEIQGATGVRVLNGNVSGFGFGVVVHGSANVVLRDLSIRAKGLSVSVLPPETGVMIVQSRNVVVENNRLYNVGLGIFVRGGMSWGNRIVGNTLTAGTNGLLGICYNPTPSDPTGPRGDTIEANHVSGFPTGIQMASAAGSNIIRNNTIAYVNMAIELKNAGNVVENNTEVMLP